MIEKKRMVPFALLVFSAVSLAGCGAENVQEQVNSEAETSETNETEQAEGTDAIAGTLSFYTSQPDADAEALVAGFREQYPDVDVTIFRSGTEEVVSRLLAEEEAGSVQADVLLLADAVTFENLKEKDLLLPYESPELAHIPADFVDQDYMYIGTKLMATVLAYNTDLVEEAPTSWFELTADNAKGELTMPSPLYSGAAAYNAGVFSRNDDFGWSFYEKLYENETTVVQGNGGVVQAVAGGEASYGMVVDFVVANAKEQGSPIDFVYPEEGVPVITEPIAITKNSKNEGAAKAFVDFVLSEEGQQLGKDVGYTPIREGIDAPAGLKGGDELHVLSADLADLLEGREEDKEQFQSIFGAH
ncbi:MULTISPECIES: ABC transporter substrate-binding protein [Bacillaceae]|uniref:Fe(3+) ABC transporter substrate-binding protein n=1 Tax=Shouchella clausii TaxID=79880 RepID=A0A268RVF1_SHOCL|nr:Fe(3+) ABC transporter substrate-binding protein [Bacillus sp. 7520-S]PAE93139.1 Fe(3+) ABC transporter substrate-binding protein [Shouchella clausii]PAF24223.1 Fe(3+) ABC transporter substrate-binding protein [Shouchella clausii]